MLHTARLLFVLAVSATAVTPLRTYAQDPAAGEDHAAEPADPASEERDPIDASEAANPVAAPTWRPGDPLPVQAAFPGGSTRAFLLPNAQETDVGEPAFGWPFPHGLVRIEVGAASPRAWWLMGEDGSVFAQGRPRDAEPWERVTAYDVGQNGSVEVVLFREDPSLPGCGDRFVPVAPRVWDPVGRSFRAATIRPDRPNASLPAEALATPSVDRVVVDTGVPVASSGAPGGGGGPVPALRDGDPASSWVEDAPGAGVGQVVHASVLSVVPTVAVELDAAPGVPLPSGVVLITDAGAWFVALPEASRVRIALPEGTSTACVQLAIESVPDGAATSALAELRVVTALDSDPNGARDALLAAATAATDEAVALRIASLLEEIDADLRRATLTALVDAANNGDRGALTVLGQLRPRSAELPLLLSSPLGGAELDAVMFRVVDTPDWAALVEQTQTNNRPSADAILTLASMRNDGLVAAAPLVGAAAPSSRQVWLAAASAPGAVAPDDLIRAAAGVEVETQRMLLYAVMASTPRATDPTDPTDPAAVAALTALLAADDGSVARLATQLFGHRCVADPGALAAMTASDPSQHLRAEAARTLARLARCSNAAASTLDALAAAFTDPNATVRLAAATAVREEGLSLLFAGPAQVALATETWPEVRDALEAVVSAPVSPR